MISAVLKHIRSRRESFVGYLLFGLFLIACCLIMSSIASNTWIVEQAELINYDALLELSNPQGTGDIVVIYVDDADYESLFRSTSPLKAETIIASIRQILSYQPRVLGVDIDTRGDAWKAAAEKFKNGEPIVWSAEGYCAHGDDRRREGGNCESFRITGAEGGECSAHDCGPVSLLTRGGVAREFYPSVVNERGERIDSFARLICKRADVCREKADRDSESKPKFIRYYNQALIEQHNGPFYSEPFHVLKDKPNDVRDLVKNRIVILGTSFHEARDMFETPFGRRDGVAILANIVEAELHGGNFQRSDDYIFFLEELVIGVILLVVGWFVSRAVNFLLAMIFAFAASIALCVFTLRLLNIYVSFIPIFVGLLIHAIVEHALNHREIVAENNKLRLERASMIVRENHEDGKVSQ